MESPVMLRFLQAAIVPVLAITMLAFASDDAEAAKGVKKNKSQQGEGKVFSVSKGKNGQETITVKTHNKKKKNAAAANGAANQVAAQGAKGAGKKKGKGQTKEFTVDRSTKITNKGGGGGKGAAAAAGKGKGKR